MAIGLALCGRLAVQVLEGAKENFHPLFFRGALTSPSSPGHASDGDQPKTDNDRNHVAILSVSEVERNTHEHMVGPVPGPIARL